MYAVYSLSSWYRLYALLHMLPSIADLQSDDPLLFEEVCVGAGGPVGVVVSGGGGASVVVGVSVGGGASVLVVKGAELVVSGGGVEATSVVVMDVALEVAVVTSGAPIVMKPSGRYEVYSPPVQSASLPSATALVQARSLVVELDEKELEDEASEDEGTVVTVAVSVGVESAVGTPSFPV